MQNRGLTRRAFLKFAAAAVTLAGLPTDRVIAATSGPGELNTEAEWRRGRAIYSVSVRSAPSWNAPTVFWIRAEEVVTILAGVLGDHPESHNNVWYLVPGGYAHSAWIQPMRAYGPQPVVREIPEWGFWGEIIRPYTSARSAPRETAPEDYIFYYGTIHHVIDRVDDPDGGSWYQVYDELPPPTTHWVRAHHVRRLTEWDFRPISPHIPLAQKRIEIDRRAQSVICYENAQPVFFTRCASGNIFHYDDGSSEDFTTPEGEHVTLLKQPSRHMQGGAADDPAGFDLPGVPWNIFFTYEGVAIHGTFWHNDYGVTRSHGCVNVSPEAAQWIYRWTYPIAPYEDDFVQSDATIGTPIIVF